MALTDTAIRGAKPGKRPYKVYDRDGLFPMINPSGSKLWRCRFDSKEKLMALGEYPVVNLVEARERQFTARKKLAGGGCQRHAHLAG
jgi:Arm DNA-binding domain